MPRQVAVPAAMVFASLVMFAVGGAGCSRKKAPVAGIGDWKLLETTLEHGAGYCSGDEVTMCSHAASIQFGGQSADIHLYFRGKDANAPLVEIAIVVRACDPEAAERTLVDLLGAPGSRADKVALWPGKAAVVVARLPADGRRCEISFVEPGDTERIAELSAE